MALPISNPHPVTENPVVLRVRAVLPAAPLFDAAPLEFAVAGFDHLMLYITYDAAALAVGGGISVRPQISPYAADLAAPQQSWFRAALYAAAAPAAGVDSVSPIQDEDIQYIATGLTPETFVYGPIELASVAERFRVLCSETGDPLHPGIAEVVGVLYE